MVKRRDKTKDLNLPLIIAATIVSAAILLSVSQGGFVGSAVEDRLGPPVGDISGDWDLELKISQGGRQFTENWGFTLKQDYNDIDTTPLYGGFFVLTGKLEGNRLSLKGSFAGGDEETITLLTDEFLEITSGCSYMGGNFTWQQGLEKDKFELKGLRKDKIGCGVIECAEDWECTGWNSCVNGIQKRTCTDKSQCGTVKKMPIENQPCIGGETPIEPAPEGITKEKAFGLTEILLVAAVLAIIGLAVLVSRMKKSKPKEITAASYPSNSLENNH